MIKAQSVLVFLFSLVGFIGAAIGEKIEADFSQPEQAIIANLPDIEELHYLEATCKGTNREDAYFSSRAHQAYVRGIHAIITDYVGKERFQAYLSASKELSPYNIPSVIDEILIKKRKKSPNWEESCLLQVNFYRNFLAYVVMSKAETLQVVK